MNSKEAGLRFLNSRKNFRGFEDRLFMEHVPSFLQDVAHVRLNQSLAMKKEMTVGLNRKMNTTNHSMKTKYEHLKKGDLYLPLRSIAIGTQMQGIREIMDSSKYRWPQKSRWRLLP